jgi:hypothetical protein
MNEASGTRLQNSISDLEDLEEGEEEKGNEEKEEEEKTEE